MRSHVEHVEAIGIGSCGKVMVGGWVVVVVVVGGGVWGCGVGGGVANPGNCAASVSECLSQSKHDSLAERSKAVA